jgi:hypothetical protein
MRWVRPFDRSVSPSPFQARGTQWLEVVAVAAALLNFATPAPALSGPADPSAPSNDVSVELNKLEPLGKGCRAYVVIDNATSVAYSVLKLDLVLFRPDGMIDRRVAVDLGPLRASKKDVKTFDFDASPCSALGSILVNDVLDCKVGEQAVSDCLDKINVSSRVPVALSK